MIAYPPSPHFRFMPVCLFIGYISLTNQTYVSQICKFVHNLLCPQLHSAVLLSGCLQRKMLSSQYGNTYNRYYDYLMSTTWFPMGVTLNIFRLTNPQAPITQALWVAFWVSQPNPLGQKKRTWLERFTVSWSNAGIHLTNSPESNNHNALNILHLLCLIFMI